ncbi:MAG: T9SS type A sorting domain-containing protein [Saprospiraceae bacterium]|nr:T9SS type A sorting domain-containing protein [Saprospiraceae bacterium]
MMRIQIFVIFILWIVTLPYGRAQSKYDYTWILGYEFTTFDKGGFDDAAEGMILNFNQSPPLLNKKPIPNGLWSSAVLSNSETGQLMFYTNGCRIFNKNHETMTGGDSINPGVQFTYFCNEGPSSYYSDFNGNLALPWPGTLNKNKYILFTRPKNLSSPSIEKILYHIIDMDTSDSLGRVIQKNVEIFKSNELALISLQACKHQNGRDWWILFWERHRPEYHVLLLDENGPRYSHSANIGSVGPSSIGQACFSPDGSQYIWFDHTKGLVLYDFDRETGTLSRPRHKIILPYYQYGDGGVSFSPSGRFVYLSARQELFQLDTWEEDFEQAFTLIDTIHFVTYVGIPLDFSNSMLAPDCKIYISTSFTWFFYHVIHHPDEKGAGCGLKKMDLELPWPNSNSAVPNMVHYRMDEEEICDRSLTSLFPEEWYQSKKVKIYPNPAYDRLHIEAEGDVTINMINIAGETVVRTSVIDKSSIDISTLPAGVYFVRIEGPAYLHPQVNKLIKL